MKGTCYALYINSDLQMQNVPCIHVVRYSVFRSVRCTQKEETVSDTPQQMMSMYTMQAIRGGLKRVRREVKNMAPLLDDVHM